MRVGAAAIRLSRNELHRLAENVVLVGGVVELVGPLLAVTAPQPVRALRLLCVPAMVGALCATGLQPIGNMGLVSLFSLLKHASARSLPNHRTVPKHAHAYVRTRSKMWTYGR